MYSLGFTTGEGERKLTDAAGSEVMNVFVATTPNPTSGIYLLVPRDEVKILNMSVEEGLKLVVSSGAVHSQLDREPAKAKE